jgi:hypothetical protein
MQLEFRTGHIHLLEIDTIRHGWGMEVRTGHPVIMMVEIIATIATGAFERKDAERDMKCRGCIWGFEIMK